MLIFNAKPGGRRKDTLIVNDLHVSTMMLR